MNSENPYSAPISQDESITTLSAVQNEALGTVAKRVFLDWEKLRLVFVAVLGIETVAIGVFLYPLILNLEFWVDVILGAVAANCCFFLGPIIETYIRWLGFPARAIRVTLFVAGTLFSFVLVAMALFFIAAHLPNQV